MDSAEKFWLGVWSIVAITLISVLAQCFMYNYAVEKLAFENGYQKVMGVGSNIPLYHKVAEEK